MGIGDSNFKRLGLLTLIPSPGSDSPEQKADRECDGQLARSPEIDERYETGARFRDLQRPSGKCTHAATPASAFSLPIRTATILSTSEAAAECIRHLGNRHDRLAVDVNRLAEYRFHRRGGSQRLADLLEQICCSHMRPPSDNASYAIAVSLVEKMAVRQAVSYVIQRRNNRRATPLPNP